MAKQWADGSGNPLGDTISVQTTEAMLNLQLRSSKTEKQNAEIEKLLANAVKGRMNESPATLPTDGSFDMDT